MLLNLLFKICPYVQCGLIIALIVAGISLVGSALLSCFWLPSTAAANNATNSLSKLQQRQSTQKCRLLLIESVAGTAAATAGPDMKNKKHKDANVCIEPLLPAMPTTKPTIRALDCERAQPQVVDQQRNKSKLKQWQDKFNKKDNTLLPFLHDELMASPWM